MPLNQTPAQKRAVEAILHQAQDYVDMRFEQVRRINPHIEAIWDDVSWQQMTGLRISLASDKSFGPVRCHVGETLLGDDLRRAAEFFNPNSQVNLLGEIIEEREKETARTAGVLEIHDMRSLFRAVEPTLERIVTLLQTFVWWDLNDAVDLARFDKKLNMALSLREKAITPEIAEYYKSLMGVEEKPDTYTAVTYELKMLEKTVESFRLRRSGDFGYRMIVMREKGHGDNVDTIIDAIASQNSLLKSLQGGSELEGSVRNQLAKAMNKDPNEVTPPAAMSFLESTVDKNKKRLKQSLLGQSSGPPYNCKARDLQELEAQLEEIKKSIGTEEPS